LFDLFAADYGYTPDQIFDLTPRQFQEMQKCMNTRRHNDRAFKYHLAGFKIKGTAADFIDPEMEKMFNEMSKGKADQKKAHLELLESQKKAAKNGKKS
jgi:hypothetical protein